MKNMKNRSMKIVSDQVILACQHIMELLTGHEQVRMEYHHSDPVMQLAKQAVRTQVPCLIVVNLSPHMGLADE